MQFFNTLPPTPAATLGLFLFGLLLLTLGGCDGPNDAKTDVDSSTTLAISGSVGDGPIYGAEIVVTDSAGSLITRTESNGQAKYLLDFQVKSSKGRDAPLFPLHFRATGGTDMVTGTAPDFDLLSVAVDESVKTVNLNPFSTLIVKTAALMEGGVTSANLEVATEYVLNRLAFGLDPLLIPDPVRTPIGAENVATIIKASEAMGELFRRVRDALLLSGDYVTVEAVIESLAADIIDGVVDGDGADAADPRIAATTNVLSAQVLTETLINRLTVGGTDAMLAMDAAIEMTTPNAHTITEEVVITENALRQAEMALRAAYAYLGAAELETLVQLLNQTTGSHSADSLRAMLPSNMEETLSSLDDIALESDSTFEAVNGVVRAGDDTTPDEETELTPVLDTEAPTITLLGDNPITVDLGEAYVEPGAVAEDDVDGDISSEMQINASTVDTNTTGDYTVHYTVSDTAGNTVEVQRTVKVVSNSREQLLSQLVGFGRHTTGGKDGDDCWVTSLKDSGSGSLRECVGNSNAKWIRFSVGGTIALDSPLVVTSNKTIDGRDNPIAITGYGLLLHGVNNVIIHNIEIRNGVGVADNSASNDAIQIWRGSTNIWINHVTASGFPDELLDISHASTGITVSWNKFAYDPNGHNLAILISSWWTHTQDVNIRVTMHHNYFDRLDGRIPRLRFGKVHTYNNYFYNWRYGASWASQLGQIFSEKNIYEAIRSTDALKATPAGSDPDPGECRDEESWILNGAQILERNPQNVFEPLQFYPYQAEAADANLRARIVNGAGITH